MRVTPDPALVTSINTVKSHLTAACRDFSIEEPENYHITLAFLGQPPLIDAQTAFTSGLARISAADRNGPLKLPFQAVQAFGSRKQAARVIWAEPAPNERLNRIAQAFSPWLNHDKDGQIPHLTLARLRSPADSDWATSRLVGQPISGSATLSAIALLANVGTGFYQDLMSVPFDKRSY